MIYSPWTCWSIIFKWEPDIKGVFWDYMSGSRDEEFRLHWIVESPFTQRVLEMNISELVNFLRTLKLRENVCGHAHHNVKAFMDWEKLTDVNCPLQDLSLGCGHPEKNGVAAWMIAWALVLSDYEDIVRKFVSQLIEHDGYAIDDGWWCHILQNAQRKNQVRGRLIAHSIANGLERLVA